MADHGAKFELKGAPLITGLPVKIGKLHLRDASPDAIMAISPARGKEKALQKALGNWVAPGEVRDTRHGRLIWSGLDQAFLFGHIEAKKLAGVAAWVDISDGWVFFGLEGPGADKVMSLLMPLDLRAGKAQPGQSFRTQLGHMMALIVVREEGFEIGVMSSFAVTAQHEIISAMESVASLAKG